MSEDLVQATAGTDNPPCDQLHAVPTPFEVALKAYADEYALWAYGHYDEPRFHAVWRGDDQISQNSLEAPMQALMIRMRADASMRAALLALSKVGLPTGAVGMRIWLPGLGTVFASANQVESFRAILRALACVEGSPDT